MLFYLLSADELREVLAASATGWRRRRIPATIDYYLARTTHGSTLSAVVHAWVLARAHREQALELLPARRCESDIADIQGGTTAEGIHLGAMAGSVDLAAAVLRRRGDLPTTCSGSTRTGRARWGRSCSTSPTAARS